MIPIGVIATITDIDIKRAEQILIDNGIEPDEAPTVLQAIGYALLDEELYPRKEEKLWETLSREISV